MKTPIERREFGKVILSSAFSAAAAAQSPQAKRTARPWPPGIKISIQMPTDPSDEDLQFVNQLGCRYVNIPTSGEKATYENFARLKNKVETAGLKVWNIGNSDVHNMEEVTLNLPGRDQKIEQYKNFIRNLGKAGLHYTTYAHMGNGIWNSGRDVARGGAPARVFDLATAKGFWAGKEFKGPLTHGRIYTEKEIWDNYEYFIKQVVPVAEEQRVFIGIHPDDPPVPMLGGVPRCIFGNFEGYKRALEIANSPNVGVCLCCGTWLEGGELMGMDVVGAIRYFGKMGKLWKIHFRNVSAPVPRFVESFVDSGYMDMWKIMRALREVEFDGVVIGDHFPQMAGGGRTAVAYTVGYMKALLERANAEFA
jgi:mannonate dehydratase